MGIDVYANWRGKTEAESKAQITGFSVMHGHVGYLREAYHGGPYATQILFPECWLSEGPEVSIPAAVLRERLPAALTAVAERERTVYGTTDPEQVEPVMKSFADFVELIERLEAEGLEPTVYASY